MLCFLRVKKAQRKIFGAGVPPVVAVEEGQVVQRDPNKWTDPTCTQLPPWNTGNRVRNGKPMKTKHDEVQERQGTGLRRAGEDITILLGALTKVGEDEAANDTE